MKDESKTIGTITKNDQAEIRARVTKFKGVEYVDLREHITSEKYTGWTAKGINFCSEVWTEFFELMEKLNDAICNEPEDDMTDG